MMRDRIDISRRDFLAGAGSSAAFVALSRRFRTDGDAHRARRRRPPVRRLAGQRPDPNRPAGTHLVPQIEHVVVVMQENHSYDSYFGMLPRGDGFRLDRHGLPTATNRDAQGRKVRAFHIAGTCQARGLSQNWNSSHIQWDGGRLDGFVRSPSGAAAMGYWDGGDLPFYYGLAETFPLCDRWFASVLGQTSPNRRFLLCGSALGSVNTILQNDLPQPPHGTIVETLNRNGISWHDYFTRLPSLLLFPPVFAANAAECPPIDRFFTDAAAGNLPNVCLVEPDGENESEESPQDISRGEAFTAKVVDAVMRSPNWPTTVLVFCYDEHGGYYDHVPPPRAVPPDDIAPNLTVHPDDHLDGLPGQLPGDYARYGFRVPAVVVSPYARTHHVSHVVRDHTSILSLIEHVWNLPALSNRDGAADSLLGTLDLDGRPHFLVPPRLPAPKNPTGAPICVPGQPGPIPAPA